MATVTVQVNSPVLGLVVGARVELERTERVNGAIGNGYLTVVKAKRKRGGSGGSGKPSNTGGDTGTGDPAGGQGDDTGTGDDDAGTSS